MRRLTAASSGNAFFNPIIWFASKPFCMAAAVVVFPKSIPTPYFLSAFPQSPPLRRTSFPFVPFHTGKTNGIRALFSALPLC